MSERICTNCEYSTNVCKCEYKEMHEIADGLCDICKYPFRLCKCDPDMDYGISQDIKQTHGKAPLGNLLEFTLALEEVVRVREYGKKKYPNAESWRQVPIEEIDHAVMRHMFNTNIKDAESEFSHAAHIIVNLLFKLQLELEESNGNQ